MFKDYFNYFETSSSQSKIKPIQFVSLEEAPGMSFDSLWLLNVTAENIPKPPELNPFLPTQLQREFNTPNSTALWEYNHSKKLLTALIESSPEIIFSYA